MFATTFNTGVPELVGLNTFSFTFFVILFTWEFHGSFHQRGSHQGKDFPVLPVRCDCPAGRTVLFLH